MLKRLVIAFLAVSLLFFGGEISAAVVDVRNTTLRPCPWEYLEVDPAQEGHNFRSNFAPPHAYPGARELHAIGNFGPVSPLLLLFGGGDFGKEWNEYFADTWLFDGTKNVWEFVDSSGEGLTEKINALGAVNGAKSFPGARWGHGMVMPASGVVYICCIYWLCVFLKSSVFFFWI